MKKIIIILILCILIPIVNAAYYVTNPVNCPSSDGTNFPGQNCAPQDICGASGSTAQCYDTSIITAPTSNTTTSGGGTNYACSDTTCSGGFITDCYATADSGAPFCNNNGAFWCDQNSTCYSTKYRETTCLKDVFASSACAGCLSGRQNCTSNNCDVITGSTNCAVGSNNNIGASCTCACDASAYDCDSSGAGVGNGCEILNGVTCGTNAIYSGCDGASGNCVCSGSYLDCDGGGESVGNGCEILNGGACSIGTLTGVYSGCNGGTGNCIVNPSDFTTGVARNYSTQTVPFLGGWDYGTALLLFLRNNATNSNFSINSTGCIKFNDGTSQCTASSSSSSGGGSLTAGVPYLYNDSTKIYFNDTIGNTTYYPRNTNPNNYFNLTNITLLDYKNSTQNNITYYKNSNQTYNDTTLANSKALPGNCVAGSVVQNTTTTGVQCVVDQTGTDGGGMVFNQNLNTSANVTFNNISVTQNVTAEYFKGNINASYILNPFWITLSTLLGYGYYLGSNQTYNDTLAVLGNASLKVNLTQLPGYYQTTNQTYNDTLGYIGNDTLKFNNSGGVISGYVNITGNLNVTRNLSIGSYIFYDNGTDLLIR